MTEELWCNATIENSGVSIVVVLCGGRGHRCRGHSNRITLLTDALRRGMMA